MKKIIAITILLFGALSQAEQYPILDGQVYNGLYYPRVDILEWGEPLHLQFQVYDKNRIVGISGETVKSGNKNIFIVAIDFKERGERLCRRVIAPPDFKPGQRLHFYYDSSDKDMNNFIVSAQPMPDKRPYSPNLKGNCEVIKAYSKREKTTKVATNRPPNIADRIPPRNHTQVIRPNYKDSWVQKQPSLYGEISQKSPSPKSAEVYDFQPIRSDFNWFN